MSIEIAQLEQAWLRAEAEADEAKREVNAASGELHERNGKIVDATEVKILMASVEEASSSRQRRSARRAPHSTCSGRPRDKDNRRFMLEIKDLHVKLSDEDKPIIKGLSLTVPKGEVHAIMGPNGSGKSTLAHVIAGRDGYEVTSGDILWNGQSSDRDGSR